MLREERFLPLLMIENNFSVLAYLVLLEDPFLSLNAKGGKETARPEGASQPARPGPWLVLFPSESVQTVTCLDTNAVTSKQSVHTQRC